jgi:hypothetical protein
MCEKIADLLWEKCVRAQCTVHGAGEGRGGRGPERGIATGGR